MMEEHCDKLSMTPQDALNIDNIKVRKDKFLNKMDHEFMRVYMMDQFKEMVNRERLNVFNCHMDYGDDFQFLFGNSMMRAYVINKIFGVASTPELKMTDKSIVFLAVNMMDRYFKMLGLKG